MGSEGHEEEDMGGVVCLGAAGHACQHSLSFQGRACGEGQPPADSRGSLRHPQGALGARSPAGVSRGGLSL